MSAAILLLLLSVQSALYFLIAFVFVYGVVAGLRDHHRFRMAFESSFKIDLTDEHEISLPVPARHGELRVRLGNFRKDYVGEVSVTGLADNSPVGSFTTTL